MKKINYGLAVKHLKINKLLKIYDKAKSKLTLNSTRWVLLEKYNFDSETRQFVSNEELNSIQDIVYYFLHYYRSDESLEELSTLAVVQKYSEYRKDRYAKRAYAKLVICKKCGFHNREYNKLCFECLSKLK